MSGAASGSSRNTPAADEMACERQPVWARTLSPTAKPARFEAITRHTVSPGIAWPISTGFAYDFASLMRPRM